MEGPIFIKVPNLQEITGKIGQLKQNFERTEKGITSLEDFREKEVDKKGELLKQLKKFRELVDKLQKQTPEIGYEEEKREISEEEEEIEFEEPGPKEETSVEGLKSELDKMKEFREELEELKKEVEGV